MTDMVGQGMPPGSQSTENSGHARWRSRESFTDQDLVNHGAPLIQVKPHRWKNMATVASSPWEDLRDPYFLLSIPVCNHFSLCVDRTRLISNKENMAEIMGCHQVTKRLWLLSCSPPENLLRESSCRCGMSWGRSTWQWTGVSSRPPGMTKGCQHPPEWAWK